MTNAEKLARMLIEREKEAKLKAAQLIRIHETANAEMLAKDVAILISASLRAGVSTTIGTANMHAAFELYDRIDPAEIPDAGKFAALSRNVRGLQVADRIIEKGRAAEYSLAIEELGSKAVDFITDTMFMGFVVVGEDIVSRTEDALVGRKLSAMLRAENPEKLLTSLAESEKVDNGIEKISECIASTLNIEELDKKSTEQIIDELEAPHLLENYSLKTENEEIVPENEPKEAQPEKAKELTVKM